MVAVRSLGGPTGKAIAGSPDPWIHADGLHLDPRDAGI